MPFADTAAQNAALDALWGADHGPTMPAMFEVGLLDGDPGEGGTELATVGGYARVDCTNDGTMWPPAEGGVKTSTVVAFPSTTDAWPDDAEFWGIYVNGALFDYGRLSDPVAVDGAGPGPQLTLTRYFDSLA